MGPWDQRAVDPEQVEEDWKNGAKLAPDVEGRVGAVRMGYLSGRTDQGWLRWRRVRGLWVLIDREAARVLDRPVRDLNRCVARHPDRFPEDFAFLLTPEEWMWKFFRWEGSPRTKRMPMAYSPAGLLQLWLLGPSEDQPAIVRWLARSLRSLPSPPPGRAWRVVPPAEAGGNGVERLKPD